MTMVPIGRMRHRIALEKPVATPDGGGGETVSWQPVRTVWARVEPVAQKETVRAGHRANPEEYRITLRRWTDITPDWRVIFEDTPLKIRAITAIEPRRLHIVMTCVGKLGA